MPDPLYNAIGKKGYKPLKKLARGGMSTVYLVERRRDRLKLVLKVLDTRKNESEDVLARFIEEYRLISTLRSRHVVRIYDEGITDDHIYIAMEYLPNGDLQDRIDKGMKPEEAVNYLQQIGEALEDIHSLGILHRDIKPHNVMFRKDNTLVLLDYGIAKPLVGGDASTSRPGWIYGTPGYMSPEQASGKPVDQRSDLYSAGIVFYEMLLGKRLDKLIKPDSHKRRYTPGDIPPLPPKFMRYTGIVDQLLAPKPNHRYQSATELLNDLENEFHAIAN